MSIEITYNLIQMSNIFAILLVLIFIWWVEKSRGIGEWALSLSLNFLAFLILSIYGRSLQTSIIEDIIQTLAAIFLLSGTTRLVEEKRKESLLPEKIRRGIIPAVLFICVIGMLVRNMTWSLRLGTCMGYVVMAYLIMQTKYGDKAQCILLVSGFLWRSLCFLMMTLDIGTRIFKQYIGISFGIVNAVVTVVIIIIYYSDSKMEVDKSLALVDEMIINTPGVLCKLSCSGQFIYRNKGVETMLGYIESWTHLRELEEIVHYKDKRYIGAIKATLQANRGVAKFQIRLRHKQGYYIWVGIEINPIRDSKGQKIGNVLYARDMTTEKITQNDLLKNQRKFYELFQGIQDAIFIVPYSDEYIHSNFMQFNKAASDNFGYSEHECRQMCLAQMDVRFVEDREVVNGKSHEEIIEALRHEEKVIYETEYITKSGKYIPVEVTDHLFMLNKDEVIMTVVRDISERNIIKETRELEKLKSDFLANVSHELRTPLNVIITTLQLLEISTKEFFEQVNQEESKLEKYNQIMKQNALRLLKLVNNFVCMAKIESGFYEINKKNYNIVTLVEDISQSVVTYIEGNGISFEFDTDVEEKIVACDIEMIEKIVLNLISNAVKFTESGGTIDIHIKDQGERVRILVRDSGFGIPKEKQKVIFERFRQADKTFTRKQEGCGIGLSLVNHFVRMHEGTIEVESEVGKGTTFIVELPALVDVDDADILNVEEDGDALYSRALEFSDIYKK